MVESSTQMTEEQARELAERGPVDEENVPQVGDLPSVITPAERSIQPDRQAPTPRGDDEAPKRKFRLFRRGGEE